MVPQKTVKIQVTNPSRSNTDISIEPSQQPQQSQILEQASPQFTEKPYPSTSYPYRIKKIKKFCKKTCNCSRLVLCFLFLLIVATIIIIVLLLRKNPFIFVRPHCKSQFGDPSLNATFDILGQLETGLPSDTDPVELYSYVGSLSCIGRYQFTEPILLNLGYYNPLPGDDYYKNGSDKNLWKGTWTGKNGCYSYQDFLKNKQDVQEHAIREAFQLNLAVINQTLNSNFSFLEQPFKFTGGCNVPINGEVVTNVTMAGILASAHLIDAVKVANAFLNATAQCDDIKKESITMFLSDFNECDFSKENIDAAVSAFDK
ncbi:12804_t:CDS:1 [Dentiscutata erythropus]|uniref:12804_t:CDS:1 n=1 Tax=Dentiscutata erythropus TaxID=1348616 RepID=A0A9N8WAV2_9GLOM|nr:12804_t:CDS:1 [Dentiscutata erythropus]